MKAGISVLISLLVSLVPSPALSADSPAPAIVRKGEVYELTLPASVKKALADFNARFKPWTAADYAPEVRHGGYQEKLKNRAPFALVIDVNADGIDDLILDGHDDKKSLLIGVVSNGPKYIVSIIRESELFDPQALECEFEGKKQKGFAYYLFIQEKRESDSPLFSLAWPQQSGVSGELLNDGGIVEYYYKDGRIEEGESFTL